VKTPSKYSSDISRSTISTNNGLLSDKLASFPRFSSNDTDNVSEKSGSSKSSFCPVDSTTKIDMEDNRGKVEISKLIQSAAFFVHWLNFFFVDQSIL
jgi:hypothetical protein